MRSRALITQLVTVLPLVMLPEASCAGRNVASRRRGSQVHAAAPDSSSAMPAGKQSTSRAFTKLQNGSDIRGVSIAGTLTRRMLHEAFARFWKRIVHVAHSNLISPTVVYFMHDAVPLSCAIAVSGVCALHACSGQVFVHRIPYADSSGQGSEGLRRTVLGRDREPALLQSSG